MEIRADSPGCFLLPGGDAPELVVFSDLQKIAWGKISDRTGRAYADVADACTQAMALTDHHDWIKSAATKLILPGEILWQAMAAEWSINCLDKLSARQNIQSISDLLLAQPTAISSPPCGCRFSSDLLTLLRIKRGGPSGASL